MKYKYIRIQDLKLKFEKTKNVRVYMSSLFRFDKEVNTYYPWDIMEEPSYDRPKDLEYEIEMYNTTVIWVVPFDNSQPTEFEVSFYVYTLDEYLYGNKYNLISI